jgi:hypothetical protein
MGNYHVRFCSRAAGVTPPLRLTRGCSPQAEVLGVTDVSHLLHDESPGIPTPWAALNDSISITDFISHGHICILYPPARLPTEWDLRVMRPSGYTLGVILRR